MEAQLDKELMSLANFTDGKMTVSELVARYVKTKTGVRESTKAGYVTVQRLLAREKFGSQQIKNVKFRMLSCFLSNCSRRMAKAIVLCIVSVGC